jgi:ferredoxin
MGKITGFLEIERVAEQYAPPFERKKNYKEFVLRLTDDEAKKQGARCMDCGIPFCHNGCPVNNIIPDWNDLVYKGNWKEALDTLHSTNNFPEFTLRPVRARVRSTSTTMRWGLNPSSISSLIKVGKTAGLCPYLRRRKQEKRLQS